jgi:hypothetical protein
MKLNTSYVQKCKTVAHIFQIILIFIAGCITIAVFTKGGETGGATRYYFALVRCPVQRSSYEGSCLTVDSVSFPRQR